LKTKYSPGFKAMYDALPRPVQKRFKAIDEKVAAGNLDLFDRQGWGYFVDIDKIHTALGNYREKEKVFYWVLIGPSELIPVIL
jgi:hypothetical protein